jgi:antitoxin component of MazEF toxin-antitoxin module
MGARRRLYRSGNSIVVAIPEWMLADIGLSCGDHVEVTTFVSDGFIMISRDRKGETKKETDVTEQKGGENKG